jgi:hypothetical protein
MMLFPDEVADNPNELALQRPKRAVRPVKPHPQRLDDIVWDDTARMLAAFEYDLPSGRTLLYADLIRWWRSELCKQPMHQHHRTWGEVQEFCRDLQSLDLYQSSHDQARMDLGIGE